MSKLQRIHPRSTHPHIACAALLIVPSVGLAQSLGPPDFVGLPGRPSGLTLADFDGDGRVDAAVALGSMDTLALVLDLDGAAVLSLIPVAGTGPVAVAAGDLDDDGAIDLVSADQDGDSISILLGAGDGTFAAPLSVPAAGAPREVALADLDLDGTLDLIAGLGATERVRIWRGQGDGSFVFAAGVPVGGVMRDLRVATLDGDPLPEVIVAAEWGGTRILRNQGSFAFTSTFGPATFGGFSASVDFGDADGDGDLDIAWVEEDGLDSCIEVTANTGSGAFISSAAQTAFLTFDSYDRVRFASLDGDGDLDLVAMGTVAFFGAPRTWIQTRSGGAGVGFVGPIEEVEYDGLADEIAVGDLDADGFDDVVVSDRAGNRLAILRNLACGDGAFLAAVEPSVVETVNEPGTELLLSGCGLETVTSAEVAGVPVEFALGQFGQPTTVTLPPLLPVGPTTLVLQGPAGPTSQPLEVVPASQPVLAIAPGPNLSVSTAATVHVGVGPSEVAFLGVSPDKLPSEIPGQLELGIGDGFLTLFPIAAQSADGSSGVASFPIPTAGLATGVTVHFQAVVATLPAPTFPLPATNVVSATTVP